eukprot:CAMPEP_0115285278 /NCGR_PEP_ID=MMETSP0270-20121206/61341_1 /TAXON_ID=71861 /ORGANISM="Scrippsiella trochoidea, Strain CCMP3099" /LENGTH=57 /DNA_ID=CAMNT_0002702281 /DNA_START=7 /DNA_END=176 /DNA_ORIENTATION=-
MSCQAATGQAKPLAMHVTASGTSIFISFILSRVLPRYSRPDQPIQPAVYKNMSAGIT